jgi:hypothetical protein
VDMDLVFAVQHRSSSSWIKIWQTSL